ncbi:hypothetical protein [Candidatus Neomicrothrix sp.]|uniref:hypothetical protein n=1 Tax=Candidatus Neomicrothrix sp. TaxID=2719034 RepID=UPI003CD0D39C
MLGILTGLVPGTPAGATGPPPLTGISQLTAGSYHTCALLTNGTVTCWGNGVYGQLGNGAGTSSNIQVPVSGITNATAIAAGSLYTCAVLATGTVRCWGETCTGNRTRTGGSAQHSRVAVTGINRSPPRRPPATGTPVAPSRRVR